MATPYQERALAAPERHAESAEWLDAAGEKRLLVKHCESCDQHHHYPRSLCPFCFSDRTQWHESNGRGTIYSYTITRRAGTVPYALAYVTLDDCGVTMMTNIVDCDLDELRVGQRVKLAFKTSGEGFRLPMFTPDPESE